MTGREIIELIQKNNWEDADIWMSVQGYIGEVKNVEEMFPKLPNTCDVMISDDCETERDNYFWESYYGSYLNLIPKHDADVLFKDGDRSFLICPCDGTEYYIPDDITEEEWEELKNSDVLFGLEK